VDGLELGMGQPALNEQRKRIVVKELLEVVQGRMHFMDRWRHKRCFRNRASADPILAGPELARRAVGPADPCLEQLAMDLADQPKAQGQRLEPLETVVHGIDVVDNFPDVLRELPAGGVDFKLKNILQRALGALDLRTQDCFLTDIHRDEEIRVWEDSGNTIHSTQRQVRLGRQPIEFLIHSDGRVRWQGSWYKGPVSSRLFYIASRTHHMLNHSRIVFYQDTIWQNKSWQRESLFRRRATCPPLRNDGPVVRKSRVRNSDSPVEWCLSDSTV